MTYSLCIHGSSQLSTTQEKTMSEELLTIPETGKIIKAGRTYTYSLINSGALKAVKIGKKTLVPRSSIESFIAALQPYKATA